MPWVKGVRFGTLIWPGLPSQIVLAAFLSLLLPSLTCAQGTTGLPGGTGASAQYPLEGQVTAENEQSSLQGVRVTVINFRGLTRAASVTDTRGGFSFQLQQGQYTLNFTHPGFHEQNIQLELMQGGQRDLQVVMFRRRGREEAAPGTPVAVWALQIPARAQKEFNQGLVAMKQHQSDASIAHFEAAIHLYPRFATAYGALGSVYLTRGDAKAAEAAFGKALQIDENLLGASMGLGTLYAQQKRFVDAEKHLLQARLLRPNDWRIHFQLGEVYWYKGGWAQAEESLERAIELHSDYSRAHLYLMNSLVLQEKYADGLREMDLFLQKFPQDPFAEKVRHKRDQLKAEIEKNGVAAVKP